MVDGQRVLWEGPADDFLDDEDLQNSVGEYTACVRIQSTGENVGTLWILTGTRALALIQESEDDPLRADAISLMDHEVSSVLASVVEAGIYRVT